MHAFSRLVHQIADIPVDVLFVLTSPPGPASMKAKMHRKITGADKASFAYIVAWLRTVMIAPKIT